MAVSFFRGTAGYIIHIICGKCIVVNFEVWNVEAFSYVIAFGPCFSHTSNPTISNATFAGVTWPL
jgi:hypothetical protein